MNSQNINATRTVVIAFALLCGLSGITAGLFELQQGNVKPDNLIISTIGLSTVCGERMILLSCRKRIVH